MLRRFLIPGLLFVALAPVSSFAQSILPDQFAVWRGAASQPVTSGGVEQFGGKAAPVLREYGINAAQQISYSRDNSSLQVTVYRANDATGAYGAYSYLRTPEMSRADFTAHSSLSRDRALILTGNLILDVSGSDLRGLHPGLRALVAQVQSQAGPDAYPSLYKYLPTDAVIHGSDRYVLGPIVLSEFFPFATDDWIGFSKGAEIELARYRVRGQEETLLLAE
ncbi:MAG: DUF6599 family protein, partial [Candidatus Acidiferrales bacterium]